MKSTFKTKTLLFLMASSIALVSCGSKSNSNFDLQDKSTDNYTPQSVVEAYYQTLNAKDYVANVRLFAASESKTESQIQELAAIQEYDFRELGHINCDIISVDIASSGETAVVKVRTLYIDGSGGIETFKVKNTSHGWRLAGVPSYE